MAKSRKFHFQTHKSNFFFKYVVKIFFSISIVDKKCESYSNYSNNVIIMTLSENLKKDLKMIGGIFSF
jgi:hypothetical protein